MSEPITAEQVKAVLQDNVYQPFSDTISCSKFATVLNALLEPILAEQERLARLEESHFFERLIVRGHCPKDVITVANEHTAALEAAAPKVSESQNAQEKEGKS